MKKLVIGALLVSGTILAATATWAEGYGHDKRGYYGEEREHGYSEHDRDRRDHRVSLFGWRLPIGWHSDDDDDDDNYRSRGAQAAKQAPSGPINNNKLITRGSAPKASIN
nr:hypothetical protein [uncultured Cohaesibacter sp.]